MGKVTDLVVEFASRFRPANDTAGANEWRTTLGDYRAELRRFDNVEDEIADGLRGLLANRNWIEVILWVDAAIARPSPGLVEPLCQLLSVRDSYLQHEWIAELLGDLRDPRAIPALREACSFEVAGDVFRSLPKRCLEALVAIGTPEAVAAVDEQLASPWIEVREWAAELLSHEDNTAH